MAATAHKPPANITRILGNPDRTLERVHVGIYDYLDSLAGLAFRQAESLVSVVNDLAAYTTVQQAGAAVAQRRRLNFVAGATVADNPVTGATDVTIVTGLSGITQLTGDGTAGPGSGSQAFTNVNAPTGFTHAGTVVTTAIVAPATPAAGKAVQYVDSTSKNLASKDDAGNVNHGVRTQAAVASNWIRAIADNGSVTISQPAFSDISGTVGGAQWGPLTGDVTTVLYASTIAANVVTDAKLRQGGALSVIGRSANSTGNVADIATTAASGLVLRESGSAIGWGQITGAAIVTNTIGNTKLAQMAGLTIKGNDSASTADPADLTGTQATALLNVFTTALKGLAPASGGGTTNFLRADGTWQAPPAGGGGITQLTGDVTAGPGSGSQAATLVNIPSTTPAAGTIVFTAISAPGTPTAGKGSVYVDSTSKNLAVKDDAGVVKHGVQTRTASASNWIRAIADDGSTTISQPAFSDISGTVGSGQFGPLTGDVTTSGYAATIANNAVTSAKFRTSAALSVVGRASNSVGNVADIATSSGTGFPLRESGGTIDWGTLATAAYGGNTVTFAKIVQSTNTSVLVGRGSSGGIGNFQEITLGTGLSMSGTQLVGVGNQFSLQFGGFLSSVGTLLPVYLGVGDAAAFYLTIRGWNAPYAVSSFTVTVSIPASSLTGTGNISFDLYVNGSTFAIGSTSVSSPSDLGPITINTSCPAGGTIGVVLSGPGATGGSLDARICVAAKQ